jgi:hypothetical protein
VPVIGEASPRADENAWANSGRRVHHCVVLNLRPIADMDACIKEDVSSDDTTLADLCPRAYVRMAPDPRARTD